MRQTKAYILLMFLTFAIVGCRATQLRQDQDHVRQTVLKLQEDQLMDNLIRAKQGLPIVHLDYTKMTGTITQNANAMVGGSQTAAAIITNVVNWGAGGSQQQVLTITADPVVNNNEIYDAYLQFIDEGKLESSPCEPGCNAAHICRKSGDTYYYIKPEHAADFLRLHLVTSVQRGQPLSVPKFFQTQIVESIAEPAAIQGSAVIFRLRFRLDPKKKIPNDGGYVEVVINGQKRQLDLEYYQGTPVIDYGKPSDMMVLLVNTDELKLAPSEIIKELSGKDVAVYLNNHRPNLKSTQDLIEAIRDDIHLLRVGQQSR